TTLFRSCADDETDLPVKETQLEEKMLKKPETGFDEEVEPADAWSFVEMIFSGIFCVFVGLFQEMVHVFKSVVDQFIFQPANPQTIRDNVFVNQQIVVPAFVAMAQADDGIALPAAEPDFLTHKKIFAPLGKNIIMELVFQNLPDLIAKRSGHPFVGVDDVNPFVRCL